MLNNKQQTKNKFFVEIVFHILLMKRLFFCNLYKKNKNVINPMVLYLFIYYYYFFFLSNYPIYILFKNKINLSYNGY